ncbi:MAG TPA: hypothetical protein VM165_20130 [Planctomycetaceae bacterium]|nr:hypothetical protein [Planctomycetaceae bacterium]
MTIINELGQKVILDRVGPDPFWNLIQRHYAHDDPRVWRLLAMFALKDGLGWSLERIGLTFGVTPGQVSRTVQTARRELRLHFDFIPDEPKGFSNPDDPDDAPETFAELWAIENSHPDVD